MAEIVLPFRVLIELERGLAQLDAVREGEKELNPICFETAVSYTLLRNAEAIAKEIALFNKLDRDAAAALKFFDGMPVTPENSAIAAAYQSKRAELLDTEAKVELTRVKLDDLLKRPEEIKKSKRNPIPQSVLNRLAPMIEEREAA
jgi:hypothetical protein